MKKFVSILTVVAMVAALSTSAFAANSPGNDTIDPVDVVGPGEEVNYGPGNFNVPDDGDSTPAAPGSVDGAGGGGAAGGGAAGGGAPAAAPAAGGGAAGGGAAGGGDAAGGGAAGGAGGAAGGAAAGGAAGASTDDATQSPTAVLDDYEEASLAYIMVKMVNDPESTALAADLIEAMGVKADFPFEECTIASNALATKTAKGVKKGDKLENGKTPFKVGQNQVTDKHDAEDLVVIVAPSKVGAKAEVCKITLDDLLNMDFETTIDDGVFTILLNTKKAE